MSQPIPVAVSRLEVRPGDVIVIKSSDRLSADTVRRISEAARGVVPAGVRLMVIDDRFDLSVMRPVGPVAVPTVEATA